MPFGCAVAECRNGKNTKRIKGSTLLFHRFPRDENLRKLWIIKCNRVDYFNAENARVCSDHFAEEDYKTDLQSELLDLTASKRLKETAVPSVFPLRQSFSENKFSNRASRANVRDRKHLVKSLLQQASTAEQNHDNGKIFNAQGSSFNYVEESFISL